MDNCIHLNTRESRDATTRIFFSVRVEALSQLFSTNVCVCVCAVCHMGCAIGVACGAIAPPDLIWWGNQYFMPHQIFKQNCQLIVNMLTINVNLIKLTIKSQNYPYNHLKNRNSNSNLSKIAFFINFSKLL